MTATQKVHVIRLLPTGNSPAARTERAYLQASRWMIPGAPKNEGIAGRAYSVTIGVAANLLRKGWVLCDAAGKLIDGALPAADVIEIRNGTEEWYALPLDQRPGTEEYRQAQLQLLLDAAYAKEQADLALAHGTGAHAGGAIDDCPACATGQAATPEQQQTDQQTENEGTGAQGSEPGTSDTTADQQAVSGAPASVRESRRTK